MELAVDPRPISLQRSALKHDINTCDDNACRNCGASTLSFRGAFYGPKIINMADGRKVSLHLHVIAYACTSCGKRHALTTRGLFAV